MHVLVVVIVVVEFATHVVVSVFFPCFLLLLIVLSYCIVLFPYIFAVALVNARRLWSSLFAVDLGVAFGQCLSRWGYSVAYRGLFIWVLCMSLVRLYRRNI